MGKRIYFVEGECEKQLIDTLKSKENGVIKPGKSEILNVVQEEIGKFKLITLEPESEVVLIYDTDVKNTSILEKNVGLIEKYTKKIKIYHIQSVRNIEEEIVYSSNIKKIDEVFKTKGDNEFKRKFCQCNNLFAKLNEIGCDYSKMWIRKPDFEFEKFYDPKTRKKL